jgi:hypothetical protein
MKELMLLEGYKITKNRVGDTLTIKVYLPEGKYEFYEIRGDYRHGYSQVSVIDSKHKKYTRHNTWREAIEWCLWRCQNEAL